MHLDNSKDFISGWGAGLIETFLLYPQSKMIFRQQLQGVTVKVALRQLKGEGITLLYRGILPPLIQRTTTRSVMFGVYDKLQKYFDCSHCATSIRRIHCFSCAAFLAGAMEAVLCPLERIQVLLQIPKYNDRFDNTAHAMREVAKIGARELYRGVTIILLRNGFSNAVFFNFRSPIRDAVINCDEKYVSFDINRRIPKHVIPFVADFISGAILGATISTLFFPVNVVKQRIQSTVGTPYQSIRQVFRIVWKERNASLKELYRGVHLNYTRSLLSWGITNSVFGVLQRILSSE